MQKFISFLICTFTIISLNAQWYAKPRSISTVLNSCNSIAVCEIYGVTSPGFVYVNDGPTPGFNTPVYVSNGDTMTDFCFYENGVTGYQELAVFNSNGYISQFLTYSTLITEDFNYNISSYVAPTNETSIDGSFIITFDSTVTAYTLQVYQNGNNPGINILDQYSLELTAIDEGYVTIYIQNPSDIYDYALFSIYAGDPYESYFLDSLNTGISFQHANSGCDGWINIQPLNAVGTVYNEWSDGTANELTRTNLCPGVYGVYTYEFVGSSYSGSIDTIVITNDNTTFIDSSLFSIVPQDTSYYFEDACTFDYGLPIDSVDYSEDTVFFSGGLLIATFDMILYQGNNMVTISDSLITLSDSTVLLDVVVYCTLFKSDDFLGRRIMFLRGVDNHLFTQPNMVSVTESEIEQTTRIYPVPAQNNLTVDFIESGDYKITVLDYQGRIYNSIEVTQTSQVTLATESLPIGAYVLVVESDHSVEKHRFVKGTN
jgi:hypothetical protein